MMVKTLLLAAVVLALGCGKPVASESGRSSRASTDLVFLTRDGCANTAVMRARLETALRELGLPTDYTVVDLDAAATGEPRAAYGTPTVLYKNRDLFGMPEPTGANPEAT